MDRINFLEKLIPRFNAESDLESVATGRCFYMLAGLFLISCIGAILYSTQVGFIGLAAVFPLVLWQLEQRRSLYMVYPQKGDQRLKAIFQASPDSIIVYNNQGHPQNLKDRNLLFPQPSMANAPFFSQPFTCMTAKP